MKLHNFTLLKGLSSAIILLVFITNSFQLKAQDDLNEKYLKAYELIRNNEPDQAITILDEVMQMSSYLENVYAMYAFAYMLKGDMIQPTAYLRQVEDMGETSIYPVVMMANQKVFEGKMDEAKTLVLRALHYKLLEDDIKDINDSWDTFIKYGKKADSFTEMKNWLVGVKQPQTNFPRANENYYKAIALAQEGKNQEAINTFNAVTKDLNALNPKAINTIYKWQAEIGATLFYSGFIEEGGQLLQNTYLNAFNSGEVGPYVKTTVGSYYADYLKYVGNFDLAVQVVDKTLPFSQRLIAKFLYASLLQKKSDVLVAVGNNNENIATATKLLQVAKTMNDTYFEAQALNSLGASYLVSTDPADRNRARQYLIQANTITDRDGYAYLAEIVKGNLAISYWQSGEKDKAIQTYQTLVNSLLAENRQQDAVINLNNVGSMLFFNEDYALAIPYFEKAINITEEYRDQLDSQNKIAYLQSQLSAYQFLTYCYARTGDGEGMFNSIEQQRARVLTDRLNLKSNAKKTNLQQFQSKLKSDEVALFYSLTEPGAVAINVVTKDASYAVLNEYFKEFVTLKQNYIDRQRLADMQRTGFKLPINARVTGDRILLEQDIANMFNQDDFELLGEITRELLQSTNPDHEPMKAEFLNFYYKFLIAPIANRIAGKKKLIISPDGLLNFIPFEALMGNDGKYLIENYGVRYIQSASVSNIIDNRNYNASRKPMLAMGGAIYEEMSAKAEPVRSVERMQEMNFKAAENASKGLSQREVYAALGFGKMNYLPGTLNEVKTMAEVVQGADVYTGTQMNEAFLKQLSNEGKLANYKVVHLATHGFALPEIPELSGIAMSIFKDEKDNQDGYLISSEIASLKLNADLVVLSACETGLGKIYGGEGVMGLTQSLIIAGANGAAVSLWPVNDASTMYFMAGMYELKSKTNWSYADAMDDMKRRFIKGEFGEMFRGTNFWAPFIHYGN